MHSPAFIFSCLFLAAHYAIAAPSAWLGPEAPGIAYPTGEADRQFEMISRDLGQRAHFQRVAPQTFRREALIWETDRDPLDVLLRRTESLLGDIIRHGPDLRVLAAELATLCADAEATPVTETRSRRGLFDRACQLRRRIAFSNPLLNFESLLFLKRHRSIFDHCCDQYYGITQRPGGGLFILSDPFGARPVVRDLLEDSVVANGRLKGQKLDGGPNRSWQLAFDGMGNLSGEVTEGGSFLSPDLAYDGRTVAFAYVECEGDRGHDHHTDPSPYGRGHFFASYLTLMPKFGFFDYGGRDFADAKWYRTTPGQFGARASRLYAMLEAGHHDVSLSEEDLHCLAVWLDSCSLFYGVYEKEGGEAQLRGEIPRPSLR
jgi:hypothetical protein